MRRKKSVQGGVVDLGLEGKVALVTGASQGIGLAVRPRSGPRAPG